MHISLLLKHCDAVILRLACVVSRAPFYYENRGTPLRSLDACSQAADSPARRTGRRCLCSRAWGSSAGGRRGGARGTQALWGLPAQPDTRSCKTTLKVCCHHKRERECKPASLQLELKLHVLHPSQQPTGVLSRVTVCGFAVPVTRGSGIVSPPGTASVSSPAQRLLGA